MVLKLQDMDENVPHKSSYVEDEDEDEDWGIGIQILELKNKKETFLGPQDKLG